MASHRTERLWQRNTGNKDIDDIYSYLNRLADQLDYTLSHIDEDNFTEEFSKKVKKGEETIDD